MRSADGNFVVMECEEQQQESIEMDTNETVTLLDVQSIHNSTQK